MSVRYRLLHRCHVDLIVLALTIGALPGAAAQTITTDDTVQSVRRALERLPYYGVFDYIVFRVDRGVVHLAGYSRRGRPSSRPPVRQPDRHVV